VLQPIGAVVVMGLQGVVDDFAGGLAHGGSGLPDIRQF
jgi:hypothetical protein